MKKSKSKVQNMKKGYLIVRINISDTELFQQYPPLSTKAVEKFGSLEEEFEAIDKIDPTVK